MNPEEYAVARREWRRQHQRYRLWEMVPGLLVWTTLIGVIIFAFVRPLWAIVFIIVFDVYWLVRVFYLLIYLLVAFRRFRRAQQINWSQRMLTVPGHERIWHVVIFPTYKEPLAVLEATFAALAKSDFPHERMIVVLACEERDRIQAEANAAALQGLYGGTFGKFLVTMHPDGIAGEMAGKGANLAWAGRQAQAYIDEQGLVYDDIVVSALDSDSQVHPSYFTYLTTVFLTTPNRLRSSYQPVPVFHNNIWQSPALMRVVANGTTFWLMSETLRPDRLFTFASHSMPFRALVDVDFWQNDVVTDDSRIFLQCFVRYDGDYTVTPLYLPLSMDTVAAPSFTQSMLNTYKQQRRWAYGVENFPFMIWNFFGRSRIPFSKKIKYIVNQLEGVYSWATAPLVIFLLGFLPLHFGGDAVSSSTLGQNAPAVITTLVRLAMIGLVCSAVLSTVILPKKPAGVRRHVFATMLLQWLLFPVCMVVFGSFPATDAQTRLMLGKYLGFWVTPKTRQMPKVAPNKA